MSGKPSKKRKWSAPEESKDLDCFVGDWNVEQLRQALRSKGLSDAGRSKAELQCRLAQHTVQQEALDRAKRCKTAATTPGTQTPEAAVESTYPLPLPFLRLSQATMRLSCDYLVLSNLGSLGCTCRGLADYTSLRTSGPPSAYLQSGRRYLSMMETTTAQLSHPRFVKFLSRCCTLTDLRVSYNRFDSAAVRALATVASSLRVLHVDSRRSTPKIPNTAFTLLLRAASQLQNLHLNDVRVDAIELPRPDLQYLREVAIESMSFPSLALLKCCPNVESVDVPMLRVNRSSSLHYCQELHTACMDLAGACPLIRFLRTVEMSVSSIPHFKSLEELRVSQCKALPNNNADVLLSSNTLKTLHVPWLDAASTLQNAEFNSLNVVYFYQVHPWDGPRLVRLCNRWHRSLTKIRLYLRNASFRNLGQWLQDFRKELPSVATVEAVDSGTRLTVGVDGSLQI